jgi:pantothenate kinase type III
MLATALIGNSTIRFAFFEGGKIARRGAISIPIGGSPVPAGWLPLDPPPDALALGSVNPPRLAEVLSTLGPLPRVLVAGRELPIPIVNRYTDPSQVGVDRLLNSLAAARVFPGRGVVVLDFGTALSVSVVSPAGEFLGGPIAPGTRSAAVGLSRSTAQLPAAPLDGPPERTAATSTLDALRAGIFWAVAGAAARIVEELSRELPFPFACIATGGDAPLFAPAVRAIERVDADLALRGLAICHDAFGR